MDLPRRAALLLVMPALLFLMGCPPAIGDACEEALDCSINGDRECDPAQPSGYCTIRGCDPNTCPDTGICVEWRYDLARSSETWCMAQCGGAGECRVEDGYACMSEADMRLLEDGTPVARIVDTDAALVDASFCVAVQSM